MTDLKMVGALRITDNTSVWLTETGGVPSILEIPLTAGLYYITGDGTATDLLQHLEDEFLNTAGLNLTMSVDSNGLVSHEFDDDYTISWALPSGQSGGAAEYVQAWLRFDDQGAEYSLVTDTAITGYRTHAYGYYPDLYLQTDLEAYEPRAAQLVPDNGDPQVVKVARRKKYRLKVRSFGFPREADYNEYHALVDWHDHACSGRPFRLYSDTSVSAAYSTSQRYGYQTMQMVPDMMEPAPLQGNWYKNMEWEFSAYEYG